MYMYMYVAAMNTSRVDIGTMYAVGAKCDDVTVMCSQDLDMRKSGRR